MLFTLIFIEEICNGESEQSPHVKQPKFDLKCKFYHEHYGMIMELNFIAFFFIRVMRHTPSDVCKQQINNGEFFSTITFIIIGCIPIFHDESIDEP